jgi:hypothetical protein
MLINYSRHCKLSDERGGLVFQDYDAFLRGEEGVIRIDQLPVESQLQLELDRLQGFVYQNRIESSATPPPPPPSTETPPPPPPSEEWSEQESPL